VTQEITGSPATPTPGSIVFFPNPNLVGFTYDEALAFLSGDETVIWPSSMNRPMTDLTAAAGSPPEQHTGAMIALVPATEDVLELQQSIDPKVAEPLSELHCTILFLGEAALLGDDEKQAILDMMEQIASVQPVVVGNIFGFNVWNPDAEPCVVAALSGSDLEDACMSICEVMDDAEIEIPDQHEPWVPHITLAYTPNPLDVMTDDLLSKTGPVTFDRIRVAYAGVVHDFPLQPDVVIAAGETFHLAGKHNQETHGRGGASPTEIGAADRLSKGKHLDESNPENAAIAGGLRAWTGGGQDGAQLRSEMMAAKTNPGAETQGAKFTRVVAAAPASAPVLHRGMAEVQDQHIPQQGDVFDLGPTSFTKSEKVRDSFSAPLDNSSFGVKTRVHMKVAKNSRAIQTSHYAPKEYSHEQEYVGMGRYHVTSRRESVGEVTARNGKKVHVRTVELELTQLDEHSTLQPTFRPRETTVVAENDLWG
jgi:2'-5' RNA ligase